ncbi:uncharacterized protein LOC110750852 [Prunus avium]|uniref:Uncharacterized protein LOC110750852 n=1 Tax=Prunus avium TaxID=42229 RepID=A0A6P5RPW8_PRUAV|nr:uncharacterized protein LOC110750852 [Prunus avium]
MGGFASKRRSNLSENVDVSGLREKVRNIQEEMSGMVCERKKESAAYERDMMVFAFKEAEWKQEKKKMREEVKMLRKTVEEKEERIRGIEDAGVGAGSNKSGGEKEWEVLLAEQMREERARRDETVEKWKQLYLAIKMELDELIQRTHCENGLYWRAEEEDTVEELKRDIKAKEEMIAGLKSRIVSMEHEQYKKEREIDILRQSLRIMSSKKTLQVTKNVSRDSQPVNVKQARKL